MTVKCHNITVTGNVQNTSFRSAVEYTGQFLGLSGVVFNIIDRGVVILCCGEDSAVDKLIQRIKLVNNEIEDIQDRVLSACIDLPEPFGHADVDDEIDR
ncbi:MAG: hypothetical protein D4R88_01375 [Methanosarcinales archaeon]|nr:MAG: hypothetical protein D4R88_01375 [Methanosarcinales archaeon]